MRGLRGGYLPVGAGPATDRFIVNLGEGRFDFLEHFGVGLFRSVVPGIDFEEALEFLGGGGRSLPEQGLLDRLVAEVITFGVDDTSDSSRMDVDA